MACRVRVRTIFRLLLFLIAAKIISNYTEREWGWLYFQENPDDYLDIRVHTVYLEDQEESFDGIVGIVSFEDIWVEPQTEMYHTQNIRKLIKEIGEKYKKIVIDPIESKIKKSHTSLSSLFIRTFAYENLDRSYKGLPQIEVYHYVPKAMERQSSN